MRSVSLDSTPIQASVHLSTFSHPNDNLRAAVPRYVAKILASLRAGDIVLSKDSGWGRLEMGESLSVQDLVDPRARAAVAKMALELAKKEVKHPKAHPRPSPARVPSSQIPSPLVVRSPSRPPSPAGLPPGISNPAPPLPVSKPASPIAELLPDYPIQPPTQTRLSRHHQPPPPLAPPAPKTRPAGCRASPQGLNNKTRGPSANVVPSEASPGAALVPSHPPPPSPPPQFPSKFATPTSKPSTPVSKPSPRISKPSTPLSNPSTPVSKPATPVSKPLSKPSTPPSSTKSTQSSVTTRTIPSTPPSPAPAPSVFRRAPSTRLPLTPTIVSLPYITLNISSKPIRFLCDTGSMLNLMSSEVRDRTRLVMRNAPGTVMGVTGASTCEGVCEGDDGLGVILVTSDNKGFCRAKFVVGPTGQSDCILGMPFFVENRAEVRYVPGKGTLVSFETSRLDPSLCKSGNKDDKKDHKRRITTVATEEVDVRRGYDWPAGQASHAHLISNQVHFMNNQASFVATTQNENGYHPLVSHSPKSGSAMSSFYSNHQRSDASDRLLDKLVIPSRPVLPPLTVLREHQKIAPSLSSRSSTYPSPVNARFENSPYPHALGVNSRALPSSRSRSHSLTPSSLSSAKQAVHLAYYNHPPPPRRIPLDQHLRATKQQVKSHQPGPAMMFPNKINHDYYPHHAFSSSDRSKMDGIGCRSAAGGSSILSESRRFWEIALGYAPPR